MEVPDPSQEYIDVLKKYFGHSQFRPMQWNIIYSILVERRDNCVVMATGYGKSLCYQYPAVYSNGLSIVISPLISLMQDQVLSLQMSNIPACFLGSAQTEKKQTLRDALQGMYRVIYLTPEFCTEEYGQKILKEMHETVGITMIAIDEAHCVSQWGFDFRHSYRKLGFLRSSFENIPILAVTATATPQVRMDICASLKLRRPKIVTTSFDRPNLYFAVSMKTDDPFIDMKKLMVRNGLGYKFPGSTIVYCPTKKQADRINDILKGNGVNSSVYHAALSNKIRQTVHEKFVKDEISVVVATVAFGMGIDKPDVRCVVHYGAPKEMESYYQEVGRAGRDGLPAICHVFYSPQDFAINKHLMQSSSMSEKFLRHKQKMAIRMEQYLETRECRRKLLLSHFEENDSQEQKNCPDPEKCCDICAKCAIGGNIRSIKPKLDITEDVKILLKVFDLFNSRFGLTIPIKFLRGCNADKIPQYMLKNELHGAGKHQSEVFWKAVGRLCLREGLIEENSCASGFKTKKFGHFPMSTIAITGLGKEFILRGEDCGIEIIPSVEIEKLVKKKILPVTIVKDDGIWYKGEPTKSSNTELQDFTPSPTNSETHDKKVESTKDKERQALLYNSLIRLRSDLAMLYSCMPYMIANNKMLFDLATAMPTNKSDLAAIGFSAAKIDKFGDEIIEKIKEFCNESDNKSTILDSDAVELIAPSVSYYDMDNRKDKGNQINNFNVTEINSDDISAAIKTASSSNEDLWEEDDGLFDNIALNDFENDIQTATGNECSLNPPSASGLNLSQKSLVKNDDNKNEINVPRKNIVVNIKKRKIKFEGDDEEEEPTKNNLKTNNLALPDWLNKPNAKDEIKKKVRNNSLFK